MRKTVLVIIFFMALKSLLAQSDSSKCIGLSLSYFGESITHPGIAVGLEYELWSKYGMRVKKSGKRIDRKHKVVLNGNLDTYFHKRNHVGVLLNGEAGYKYIRKKGFFYEGAAGIGYFHTFLQGDTYVVSDANEVSRVKLASQSNFSCSMWCGIGKDYSFKEGKPWAWKLLTGWFLQYPFGASKLWHTAAEVGVIYYMNFNKK